MEARFSVVEENMHKETEERIAIIENNRVVLCNELLLCMIISNDI